MENIRDIDISDFFYELPDEQIAKHPLAQRDDCKLLVRDDNSLEDFKFYNLPDLLKKDTVLIYNNSRVINARMKFRKGENEDGALIEIFCLEPSNPSNYDENFSSVERCQWKCFVGNSKKWKEGTVLQKKIKIGETDVILQASRSKNEDNTSVVEFSWDNPSVTFSEIVNATGEIPIPPYLNRESEERDKLEYQTVYCKADGSVAAPTAGLHFTEELLRRIDERDISRRDITLHVGAGTFQPVNSKTIGGHEMHREFISISTRLISELIEWKGDSKAHKDVVAVGTTTVRTLESLYYIGCLIHQGKWEGIVPQWYPYSNDLPLLSVEESLKLILDYYGEGQCTCETQLLIAPGFCFRIVDGMITNFHQPGSTLLLLISAFLGKDNKQYDSWRDIYSHAMHNGYRFLSYGDACLFL